jgi:hypothetical protein
MVKQLAPLQRHFFSGAKSSGIVTPGEAAVSKIAKIPVDKRLPILYIALYTVEDVTWILD